MIRHGPAGRGRRTDRRPRGGGPAAAAARRVPRTGPTTPRTSSAGGSSCTPTRHRRCSTSTANAGSVVEVDSTAGSTRSPDASSPRSRRHSPVVGGALMGLRDRGIEIKTPEQIDAMRRAGARRRRDPGAAARRRRGPGMTTGELDAIAEDHIRSRRRRPVVPRLWSPAVPRDDLRLGERRGGARRPGKPRSSGRGTSSRIDCGAIVDGWHGDAALTVAVGATPLARPRGGSSCGSPRSPCGAASRPPSWAGTSATSRTAWSSTSAGRAPSGSSRTTPATASGRPCTSRRPSRMSAEPAAAPALVERSRAGRRADGRRQIGTRRRTPTTTSGRSGTDRRVARRPLRAHLRAHPRRASGCSTALDGGEGRARPRSACPFGGLSRCTYGRLTGMKAAQEGSIPSLRSRQHDRSPLDWAAVRGRGSPGRRRKRPQARLTHPITAGESRGRLHPRMDHHASASPSPSCSSTSW